MATCRGRAPESRVVAFETMRPTIVRVGGFDGGTKTRLGISLVATELGVLGGELGDILQSYNKLGLTGRELGSEGAVGGGEIHHRGTITGRGSGEVGDCVDRVLLVDGGVGSLETGSSGRDLRLPPFLLGSSEEHFKVGPGFVAMVLAAPGLAVVDKEARLKNELVLPSNTT